MLILECVKKKEKKRKKKGSWSLGGKNGLLPLCEASVATGCSLSRQGVQAKRMTGLVCAQ